MKIKIADCMYLMQSAFFVNENPAIVAGFKRG